MQKLHKDAYAAFEGTCQVLLDLDPYTRDCAEDLLFYLRMLGYFLGMVSRCMTRTDRSRNDTHRLDWAWKYSRYLFNV